MSPTSVAILCCQHVPDDVRVTHKIGKSLREANIDVSWLGPRRARKGNDYGISFHYYEPSRTTAGRLLHYRSLLRLAETLPRADVYFAVEPDSAAVAVTLARRFQSRSVFDIHEVYHEEMLYRWVPMSLVPWVGRAVQWRLRHICKTCDLVVGVGRTRLDPYVSHSVPSMVVRHCVPRSFVRQASPKVRSELVIMHGKTSFAHGTVEMIRALSLLRKRDIPCRAIMFQQVAGVPHSGLTPVEEYAREAGVLDCLDIRPPITYEEMFGVLEHCDVGVIAYRKELGRRCMPNRVFEYMAMGLPVVAPAYGIEMQDIIPKYDCGILCNTEDPESLADALQWLHEHRSEASRLGMNGRIACERELNWEAEAAPLINWIMNGTSSRPNA